MNSSASLCPSGTPLHTPTPKGVPRELAHVFIFVRCVQTKLVDNVVEDVGYVDVAMRRIERRTCRTGQLFDRASVVDRYGTHGSFDEIEVEWSARDPRQCAGCTTPRALRL